MQVAGFRIAARLRAAFVLKPVPMAAALETARQALKRVAGAGVVRSAANALPGLRAERGALVARLVMIDLAEKAPALAASCTVEPGACSSTRGVSAKHSKRATYDLALTGELR